MRMQRRVRPMFVRKEYLLPGWDVPARIELLRFLMNRTDTFVGYFPEEGSDGLAIGRDDFRLAEGAEIAPWEGMKESIAIRHALRSEIRDLILRHENGESGDAGEGLWTYELLSHGDIILYVHDFSLAIISANEQELIEFQSYGFDTTEWEEIEGRPPEIDVTSPDDMKFLGEIVEAIRAWLKERFGWVEDTTLH